MATSKEEIGSITVLCPKLSCRAILRVPESARGQRVRCGNCGNALLIPHKKSGSKDQKDKAGD